ncbi:MAG: DUF429 domain-containing protein [Phreatobacter sp.]|uniref:DUF429 domain-containing protein n=1 Tax=Phreatobacter sp. TaxID=1966341 RepID=UPI0027347610|nr:DUF429 domain-containing protein [Phreatobacter sp.]MDP2801377.1 DUF429 domain-containing protein [Phreatobacter sp.]
MVRGVDGCPAGWIAVTIAAEGPLTPGVTITRNFADLTTGVEKIAVDMPIGLPERAGPGGRGAETAARVVLGGRRSSVFSVPSRSAVYALDYPEACRLAEATSDPPRKISKQAFFLFPKIRQIDSLLRNDASLLARVFETHPEVAFWRANDEAPMLFPKSKPQGLRERRDLLERHGFPAAFLDAPVEWGAKPDDFLDACVCALVARRLHAGTALSFPSPPARDAHGLPVAIWA